METDMHYRSQLQDQQAPTARENVMRGFVASLMVRPEVSYYGGASGYGVTGTGAPDAFELEGRPTAPWARVSPTVLREIEGYVRDRVGL